MWLANALTQQKIIDQSAAPARVRARVFGGVGGSFDEVNERYLGYYESDRKDVIHQHLLLLVLLLLLLLLLVLLMLLLMLLEICLCFAVFMFARARRRLRISTGRFAHHNAFYLHSF